LLKLDSFSGQFINPQTVKKFFNTSNADYQVKKVAEYLRKDEHFLLSLPKFIQKNGTPKWEKAVFKTNNHSRIIGQSEALRSDNFVGTNEEDSMGSFFIPLLSALEDEVLSYIKIFKHSKTLYSYRLYNKKDLCELQGLSDSAENNVMTVLSLFASFEKDEGLNDSLELETSFKGTVVIVPKIWMLSIGGVTYECYSEIRWMISYDYDNNSYIEHPWEHIHCEPINGGGGSVPEGGGGLGGSDPSEIDYQEPQWYETGSGGPFGSANSDGEETIYVNDYDDPDHPEYDPGSYTEFYPWWNPLHDLSLQTADIKESGEDDEANDPANNDDGDYDTTTYDEWDPNQMWPTIPLVIPLKDWVGFDGRDCMELSLAQIAKKGQKISNYFNNLNQVSDQTFQIFKESTGVNSSAFIGGMSYIMSALSRGIPVIVGVDWEAGSRNPGTDQTTDHFIVLVATGWDNHGYFIRFYDSSTSDRSHGASPNNKLYVDFYSGTIIGYTMSEYNLAVPYQVAQIRKSKPL
jgi:hypothetical protein